VQDWGEQSKQKRKATKIVEERSGGPGYAAVAKKTAETF
jgi:hypothetical protein